MVPYYRVRARSASLLRLPWNIVFMPIAAETEPDVHQPHTPQFRLDSTCDRLSWRSTKPPRDVFHEKPSIGGTG